MKTLRDPFVAISVLLVAAVVVEVLLFRIFARGGVYFIKDDTPQVVKSGYTSLVFLGNTLFNFAAPMVLLVLALAALRSWRRSEGWRERSLAIVVVGIVALGAGRAVGMESSALSLAYLGASAVAIVIAALICTRAGSGLAVRSFVAVAGLSYLSVYAFKVASGLAGVGWTPPIATTSLYALGEWLAVAGFLALIPALRHVADRRSVMMGAAVAVLALGMAFGRAESIPLIATWAFGLSLSLPYPLYVLALWAALAFAIGSFRQGTPLLGAGVLLVLLGHRTIPLTYFNDLVLAGIVLVVLSTPLREGASFATTKVTLATRPVKKAASA